MPVIETQKGWGTLDVLKALFALRDSETFPSSPQKLHTAIHELSQDPRYKTFFENCLFENRGSYWYDRDLQGNLDSINLAGHIQTYLVDDGNYHVNPSLRRSFQIRNAPHFSDSELETLWQMGGDFDKIIAGKN